MTIKEYYKNSDLTSINVKLKDIKYYYNKTGLIFNKTIMYPEGGGQPADMGVLTDKKGNKIADIEDVQIEDNLIYHIINSDIILEDSMKNSSFVMNLDITRRIDHSTQHTAQHLISAILYDKYESQTLSFHLGTEHSTIDIEKKDIDIQDFSEIENEVNQAIFENRSIKEVLFKDKEDIAKNNIVLRKDPKLNKNIRVIEIEGYDASPCGGTHLKSTGQLMTIKFLKIENYKGGYRLYFVSGMRALEDYRRKSDLVTELANDFSCDVDSVQKKIETQKEMMAMMKALNNALRKELIESLFKKLKFENRIKGVGLVGFSDKNFFDNKFIGDMIKTIGSQTDENVVVYLVLASVVERRIILESFTNSIDMKSIVEETKKEFPVKGGGKKAKAQLVQETGKLYDTYSFILEKLDMNYGKNYRQICILD